MDSKSQRGIPLLSLDLGLRTGWVVSTTSRPLYPRERPGTHCTGSWVGPSAGLDMCEKSRPYREFFFLTIHFIPLRQHHIQAQHRDKHMKTPRWYEPVTVIIKTIT
jgi:hypothetical protein